MLHILWIIVKFILILLGILLGLILLAVLLVLFCPVRYSAGVSKESETFKETEAAGKISWLFGGVSFRFWFKNGQSGKEFRVFGLPVFKILEYVKNRKAEKRKKAKQKGTGEKRLKKNKTLNASPGTKKFSPQKKTAGQNIKEERKREETSENAGDENISGVSGESPDGGLYSFFYKLGNKVRGILEKLKKIGGKVSALSDGLHNFKLTIENIYAKIKWWKRFLTHPKVQAAIALVKDQLIRLLKHMFPTKINGTVTFSCTDPSVTGTILAVLGATIPLHKNCIQINPQFEDRNMVMGTVKLKGRIYGIVLLITALKIYFNKDIKYIIKIWKKHKED